MIKETINSFFTTLFMMVIESFAFSIPLFFSLYLIFISGSIPIPFIGFFDCWLVLFVIKILRATNIPFPVFITGFMGGNVTNVKKINLDDIKEEKEDE